MRAAGHGYGHVAAAQTRLGPMTWLSSGSARACPAARPTSVPARRQLGADVAEDYRDPSLLGRHSRAGQRFDVVLDTVGGGPGRCCDSKHGPAGSLLAKCHARWLVLCFTSGGTQLRGRQDLSAAGMLLLPMSPGNMVV